MFRRMATHDSHDGAARIVKPSLSGDNVVNFDIPQWSGTRAMFLDQLSTRYSGSSSRTRAVVRATHVKPGESAQ